LEQAGLTERLRLNPPMKLYRIGEVAQYAGLSRQTVHNYTIMGLIQEASWSDGGHRLYGEGVFGVLARLEEMKGYKTLREIRTILESERMPGRAAASG